MQTIDGFVLTRQWRDKPEGVELSYWASTADGPLRLYLPAQQAVCFINQDESLPLDPGVQRKSVALKLLHGESVDALYFRQQRSLATLYQQSQWHNKLHEADIKPSDRYLMERFITASLTAQGEIEQKPGYLQISNPRLKHADYLPELKIASLDIETQGLSGQLYSIAICSNTDAWVFMLGPHHKLLNKNYDKNYDKNYSLEFFADEKALLQAFFAYLRHSDPDVLIGWNVINFDLDFLYRKCQQLGIDFAFGRGNDASIILQPSNDNQPRIARVPGRVVLDGIDLLRAGFWSFESFSLEHVAQQLLGQGKLISNPNSKVAEIDRLFREDQQQLADYNWQDCQLVLQIFDKADLINFAIQRALITGLAIDRMGGSVAAFDNLYLPKLHRQGYIARSIRKDRSDGGSPGGYVMDSRPGLYDNVLVLDFKSLYPSIIRTFLIDPLGLAVPGENPVPGFLEAQFSRQQHILPGLITELWQQRDLAKQQQNAALSQAIKIIMNSFYGVLGTSGCRFYDDRLASSITRRGHEIITRSRDFIINQGYQVIYGDTDSLFVLLGPGISETQATQTGTDLMRKLNRWWAETLQTEHQLESALEVEFETHYLRFLMPTIRGTETGSKKRYAGYVRTKSGAYELIFKGLEAARTDWTPLAREFQRELYRRVFFNEPFEDFIQDTANQLLAGKKDQDLVYRKRIRRRLEDYQRNVPPHVQAARKQQQPGRWVEYMITLNGPEPIDNRQSTPDYQHYLDKQLAPAADSILHFLDTSFAALTDAQMSLF